MEINKNKYEQLLFIIIEHIFYTKIYINPTNISIILKTD